MKKIVNLIIILFSFLSFPTHLIFANETLNNENNIIIDAYSQRKNRILELISGGKLESEITNLKTKLEQLKLGSNLNNDTKNKLISDIEKLEQEVISMNNEIKINVEDSKEFEEIVDKYNNEIRLKKELVEELNNSIKENEINSEKIDLLLNRYLAEKTKLEETENKKMTLKIYIFIFFTLLSILIYIVTRNLSKSGKINSKKNIYINFFLLFIYIIFLIWFFFYLYPQLSIFLIFISGYLLVINSHLIGSFIGSIVVLQRFKIGDVVKFGSVFGQVTRISPLYIELLPMTKEGIFNQKPIFVPHINILKENVTKDITADNFIHNFEITIRDDSGIDVIKFLEEVENTILLKFLHNKLSSITNTNDFYRISFDRTNFGHIVVVFTWRGDDILNKKVERKIIGFFSKSILEIKKQKEEQEKLKEDKKQD
ncbi:MAG: hypothetical protein PHI37_04255 [Candidatus Gracilibacteria bacterium]|nr:hypothetical protein [Candidatus Gracilibacteria bacterium]